MNAPTSITPPFSEVDPDGLLPFLAGVWPRAGLRVVAVLQDGRMGHKFLTDNDAAAAFIAKVDVAPAQVFIACQSYGPKEGGRKGDNVVACRSFALDLDAGPTKPYPDAASAVRAVTGFRRAAGLPRPTLVSSGNGIHAWWAMDADLTPSAWPITATMLKAACVKHGLMADPSRTADIASVLRPVGSTHRKAADKPVTLLRSAPQTSHTEFRASLENYLGVAAVAQGDPLGPAPAYLARLGEVSNADLGERGPFLPAYADRIADQCGVMGMIRSTRGVTDQPTWFRALQLMSKCEDGRDFAHEWSMGDPRYKEAEVDQILARVADKGPTLCSTFADHQPAICGACLHAGKIKSPIVLGYAPSEGTLIIPGPQVDPFGVAVSVMPGLPSPGAPRPGRPLTAIPHRMIAQDAVVAFEPFPFVMDWGGQSGIMWLKSDGSTRLVSSQAFKDMVSGRYVVVVDKEGNSKDVPAFDWYMRSGHRPEYDRVVYAPEGLGPGTGEKVLNTWTGFAIDPCRGSWRRVRRHLWNIICRRDPRVFKYLIRWMAHAVQRPGTAPGVVPVMVSLAEGSGKTTIIDLMCRVFGRHSLSLNTAEQLLGKFNAHLAAISFLGVNEPSFAGDHEAQRKLKSMITDAFWMIEDKYRAAVRVPNIAHVMFTTNERRAVPAGSHARRFLVLDVDDSKAGNTAYFAALYGEMNGGGVAAMLDFLLRLDISRFNLTAVPVTEALKQQQEMSASLEVRWALDVAQDPEIHAVVLGAVNLTADLYSSLKGYADTHRERVVGTTAFGRWLSSLGLQPQMASAQSGKRQRGWFIPDADVLTAAVRKAGGIHD